MAMNKPGRHAEILAVTKTIIDDAGGLKAIGYAPSEIQYNSYVRHLIRLVQKKTGCSYNSAKRNVKNVLAEYK